VTRYIRYVNSIPLRKHASNPPIAAPAGALVPTAFIRPDGLHACLLFLVRKGIVFHDLLDELLGIQSLK